MPTTESHNPQTHYQWLLEALKIATGECQEWPFSRNRTGYGQITRSAIRKGPILVHRLAYQLSHEDFNPDLHVLHHCDNPPCFCPRHLWQGTDADNKADCIAKGRYRNGISIGEANGASVLTESQVLSIRERWANGEGQHPMAREFGVNQGTIYLIVHRKKWKHI